MERWYSIGDRVEVRINHRLELGTVVQFGRVLDLVDVDGLQAWRHRFEIYAPEEEVHDERSL